jgi:hypothetical protein
MAVITAAFSPPILDTPPGVPLIGYHNVVTTGNISSTTAAVGFPITNVANPATHLRWQAGVSTGDEHILINTGGATVIDYIAIAKHNLASAQVPIQIFGHPGAIGLIGPVQLVDDAPTIFRIPPSLYTSIEIVLNLSAVPEGTAPQIAVIYAGKLLVLERGIKVDVVHVPITFGRRTRILNGTSESGNFLGRIVLSEHRESKAEFFGFTPIFYRNNVDAFLDAAQQVPFFWAWAPSEYPLETGYAWLLNDAEPEVSPDHRHIGLVLEMQGIA